MTEGRIMTEGDQPHTTDGGEGTDAPAPGGSSPVPPPATPDAADAPSMPTSGGPSWSRANQSGEPPVSPYRTPAAPFGGAPATPSPATTSPFTAPAAPPGVGGTPTAPTSPYNAPAAAPGIGGSPAAPGFPGSTQPNVVGPPFGGAATPPGFAGAPPAGTVGPGIGGAPPGGPGWTPGGSAPQAYGTSSTPRTTVRTLGLPPSLGLAVALMSFPAVGTVIYGGLAFLLGLFLSGSGSSSTSSSNGTFTTDFSDLGSGVAMVGAVGALIGLVGLYGVVMVMAGSSTGRAICTVFLVIMTFLSALQLGFGSPVAAVFGLALNGYCLWALWGRPGKGIF